MMKALKVTLAAVLVLVAGAAIAFYAASERHLRRHYDIAPEQVAVSSGAEAVAHGAHIAALRGCTDCHAADLSGQVFIDDWKLGRFSTPNLTAGKGGIGARFMPADWERALRHGVAPDGRALLIMPSAEIHNLGNDDLADLIAYVKSVPPVDHELPASRPGPLGRALIVFNLAPVIPAELIDHRAAHGNAPVAAATAEYGAYLAVTCTGCHQTDFAGGPIPGEPAIAANLTMDEATGLGRWSEEDFSRVMRTGTRPDGRQLNPIMPLLITASMRDVEVSAIWQFLKTLPVRPARTN